MCERLAVTTRDMLSTHSRLYDVQEQEGYSSYDSSNRLSPPKNNSSSNEAMSHAQPQLPQNNSPDIDSLTSIATPEHSNPPITSSVALSYPSFPIRNSNTVIPIQQQQSQPRTQLLLPQNIMPTSYNQEQGMNNNDIDFNSCEFLYDSALFGQIIFDSTDNNNKNSTNNDINYWTPQYTPLTSMPPTSSTTPSMYQPY